MTRAPERQEILELVVRPGGEELSLARVGDELSIRIDDAVLMSSTCHASELALGRLGCAHLRTHRRARVLVGGLGMGFTLRAALDAVPSDAIVEVAELVPELVEWNREHLAALAGSPLDDPRAWVRIEDVRLTLAAMTEAYDAILLDVDNGPEGLVAASNDALYGDDGIALARRALRAGGVLAVWSARDDAGYAARLRAGGFVVRRERLPPREGANRSHVVWIAARDG